MKFLLSLIIFFIITYYAVKLIGKALFPFIIKNLNKQYQSKDESGKKQEGKVNIKYSPNQKKFINDNEGEYINYKDIKDDS